MNRKAEIKYKLAELESDINLILNLCNVESMQTPDWIVGRIRSLKLDYNYVKNEVINEFLN